MKVQSRASTKRWTPQEIKMLKNDNRDTFLKLLNEIRACFVTDADGMQFVMDNIKCEGTFNSGWLVVNKMNSCHNLWLGQMNSDDPHKAFARIRYNRFDESSLLDAINFFVDRAIDDYQFAYCGIGDS